MDLNQPGLFLLVLIGHMGTGNKFRTCIASGKFMPADSTTSCSMNTKIVVSLGEMLTDA
jgi:hypothetical protein